MNAKFSFTFKMREDVIKVVDVVMMVNLVFVHRYPWLSEFRDAMCKNMESPPVLLIPSLRSHIRISLIGKMTQT